LFEPLVVTYLTANPLTERVVSWTLGALLIWLAFVIAGRIIHGVALGSKEPFWSFGLNKKSSARAARRECASRRGPACRRSWRCRAWA
jgi:hypothetical protein